MEALLKIPFDDKDKAKAIAKENRCALFWEPVSKSWNIKGTQIPESLAKFIIPGTLVEDNPAPVQEETLDWPDFFDATPTKKVEAPKRQNETYYNFVIDMPFHIRDQISQYGGQWHGLYKTYVLRARSIAEGLKSYVSHPYSYEAWIEKFINKGFIRDEITQAYAVKDEMTPRKYQVEAETAIRLAMDKKYGGFLLADEVGLGKTISAALAVRFPEFKNVLIVTTLAATAHWRKTFLKFKFDNKEILIINYDRLQKLFYNEPHPVGKKKPKTKKSKNKKTAKSGIAPAFDLVVWDESHKLKNNTSMRSKLAMKIQEKADFNLYMSATAGQNPLELSYLAPLLAKITGQSVHSMSDFDQWCKGMNLGVKRGDFGKWIWDGSQQSIDKIHNLLFKDNVAAIRRTPADIAGYPEISRLLTPLELVADERDLYNLAWNEFKKMNKDKTSAKWKENALVARLRLRQKASILKIPYTVEQIEDLLDNGHQVAVSVAFTDTMHQIADKLSKSGIECSMISGQQNSKEKEEQRMKFQTGENKVVLFTVEEAISLHQGEYNDAPRSMLIHDLRWSAISMSQIEGRTHRDGKFSQIYWLYFADSIEEDIAKIVLNRVISMKSMVGDDTQVLKEIEALLLAKST